MAINIPQVTFVWNNVFQIVNKWCLINYHKRSFRTLLLIQLSLYMHSWHHESSQRREQLISKREIKSQKKKKEQLMCSKMHSSGISSVLEGPYTDDWGHVLWRWPKAINSVKKLSGSYWRCHKSSSRSSKTLRKSDSSWLKNSMHENLDLVAQAIVSRVFLIYHQKKV